MIEKLKTITWPTTNTHAFMFISLKQIKNNDISLFNKHDFMLINQTNNYQNKNTFKNKILK